MSMCNFGRGHYEEHFCEVILNFDRSDLTLKVFLIYSSGGCFVWWSGTICAIFGRGHYEEHFW